MHYVIHSCGPQECDCSAVCNPREGDEIQITTNASQVTCGNCLRVMAKRKVPLASDQVARLQGPKSICDALQQQVEALRGLVPDMPPRPPEGDGLPRYGLRWNGPSQPLSVPMDDGYWTPWHLAYQQVESALEREQIALAHADAADDLRAQIDRLRAALHSCAKASSAAEVGLIVDDALAPEVRQPEKPLPRRPEQPEPRPYDYRPDGEWRIDTSAGREILVYKDCSVIEAEDARYVLRLISAEQGERQEAVPEETPHIIVFDDADRPNEMFSGAGARPAALRRWEQISVSWNAHLFVRVERNSRDDPYPCARLASQVNRIPAGLYAELEALRTLRDATGVYLQGYMRDEIEDEESCSADQRDAACSVKVSLDSARALEWKGGGDA